MNNCVSVISVSVSVSVSFIYGVYGLKVGTCPRVTGQSTRKSNEISLIQTETARTHKLTHTRTYDTHKKGQPNGKTRNYRSRLVANQLPLWSCVYCYIVHSSLWPNARAIQNVVLLFCCHSFFTLSHVLLMLSLLFAQRERFFFVCRVFFSQEKSEMNCLCSYGICSPHVKNGLWLCLWFIVAGVLCFTSFH